MTTTYIVRKNSRNDLADRPEYAKFARRSGGRSGGGSRSGGPRSGGGRGDDRGPRGGGRGGGSRGGRGGRGGRQQEMAVDLSKLVNKAKPMEAEAPFVPEHKFSDFPIDAVLKENIALKGYELPTPIQDKAIPH